MGTTLNAPPPPAKTLNALTVQMFSPLLVVHCPFSVFVPGLLMYSTPPHNQLLLSVSVPFVGIVHGLVALNVAGFVHAGPVTTDHQKSSVAPATNEPEAGVVVDPDANVPVPSDAELVAHPVTSVRNNVVTPADENVTVAVCAPAAMFSSRHTEIRM